MVRRFAVVSMVLAVLAAPACFAGEAERVHSVRVTGVTGSQIDEVHRRIRVRPGDVYSERSVQEDYLAILKLPFVLSATVKKSDTPEGVDITYEIDSRSAVREVRFRGNRKIKDKKLLKIGRLDDFRYYDSARLTTARDLILDEYKKKGYLFANVEFAAQEDGGVLFTVDEGKRTKVAAVSIIGNIHFDDVLLRKQIKTRTRRRLVLAYRLNQQVVEDDVIRLRDFYRDHGYLDAKVTVRFDVDERTGRRITVTYLIEEGSLYTVSSIDISGNNRITTEGILSRLVMKVGEPFSPSGLSKDVAAIRGDYGRIGYIDAEVRPATIIAEEKPEVRVSFSIDEGHAFYVNEVEIVGNDKTRDNVIRRELEFAPAEKFNTDAIAKSKANLDRLNNFAKVGITTEPTGVSDRRNVIVDVEESSTGQIVLGVGASSDSGLFGNIVYSQRNFDYLKPPTSWRDITEGRAWVGGGQTFELKAMPGTEETRFGISYKDPRVNDSRYRLGLAAQRWDRDRDTYTETRTSGTVSIGRAFGRDSYWDVSATLGRVKVSDIELIDTDADKIGDTLPAYLAGVEGTSKVNLVSVTVGNDTRNFLLTPTTGHNVSASVDVSSSSIGSDFDFLRFVLEGRWYREISRDELDRPYVVSWRGKAGYFLPKSGVTDSPIFERFYVGGGSDMRGFAYRGLGPHDEDEPLGGEFMAVGGVQYEFPLVGEVFRGAFFWDTGTLLDNAGDFQFDQVRHSVGFGFRFVIPPPLNMPFAIDLGFPIVEEDEDETQLLTVSFGRAL